MGEDLKAGPSTSIDDAIERSDDLRLLSRSPHPYHRQNYELLHPSDRVAFRASSISTHGPSSLRDQLLAVPSFTKESTPTSDSGTEADDEHFLKRLPAPKTRLHKGLRGQNEPLSGTATPLLPGALEEAARRVLPALKSDAFDSDGRSKLERTRRHKEILRRSTEVCLLVALGGVLHSNRDVRLSLGRWKDEIRADCLIVASLLALYPVRVMLWAYVRGSPSRRWPATIPSSFDPAPILYPPVIPIVVALLVSVSIGGIVLPNLILGICSIPRALMPSIQPPETLNPLHWLLSCVPLFISEKAASQGAETLKDSAICGEAAVLLYPLHQALCTTLQYLTTTSLLPAELELLSVALINLAFASLSPQSIILKALLWGGGLGLALLCGKVIRWEIALARVPKWRFRRTQTPAKRRPLFRAIVNLIASRGATRDILRTDDEYSSLDSGNSSGDAESRDRLVASPEPITPGARNERGSFFATVESVPVSPIEANHDIRFTSLDGSATTPSSRRHTISSPGKYAPRRKTHTPSGRRKRAASFSIRPFFSLTQEQATMRKWLYAAYVYVCILAIILVGIREYVKRNALFGNEPFGWALGYLFGDLPWFRFQVVKANLERWICLPPRSGGDAHAESCPLGRAQQLRHASLGEANTRLVLAAYWLAILMSGLAVVFRLSPVYEVDTRRKVFHLMMVAMFLPATFVDPAYAALALSLALAIFLLLDLLRAGQLPPLSKPIARFLAPFVDGRDHRGPVVISHIFLLVGCAVPLWLSLASLPRSGSGALRGWEVPTRDVSMVSGVVCVGLGDAAASLIGRRWGHHKWRWGGGKSLEGSLAFAVAVFAGLMTGSVWMRLWGWPATTALSSWGATVRDTGVCASLASLTEAVLTGGNDNVIVPVVLWTCVRSLGI